MKVKKHADHRGTLSNPLLGVRRAGVTGALQAFEAKGLIATARGSVTIKDRDGLEESANGLYGVPESEFERLFG